MSDVLEERLRALQQIRDWYHCDHEGRVEVRRRMLSNGVTALWEQCAHCGTGIRAVKKSTYSEAEQAAMPPFDDQLQRERYDEMSEKLEACRARYDEAMVTGASDRHAEYRAYLRSPAWQRLRVKVLRRARGLCEGCGEKRPVEVHHLTYEHIFEEFLFELVAVCSECHRRLHPDKGDEKEVA